MNQLLTGSSFGTGGSVLGAAVGGVPGAIVGGAAGLALPATARAVYTNPLMQAYLRNQLIGAGTRNAITGLRNNLLTQQVVGRTTD